MVKGNDIFPQLTLNFQHISVDVERNKKLPENFREKKFMDTFVFRGRYLYTTIVVQKK